jgi:hypothetical protein
MAYTDASLQPDLCDVELSSLSFHSVSLEDDCDDRDRAVYLETPCVTQRPTWQEAKRASKRKLKARWLAAATWLRRCGALVGVWVVASGLAFAWGGFGARKPLLHNYSPAEIARGDFEVDVAELRRYLVATDPTSTCVAGNVVGSYRSAVLVVVSELAPPLIFLNPQVSLASERENSPLHLDPDSLLRFPGSGGHEGGWPPTPRVVYEETGGCDAVPPPLLAKGASWWWWSWLASPVPTGAPPTYRPWGEEGEVRKFQVSRENTVWVQWVDAETRLVRESWVSGFPAECLQHTSDVSAGAFACSGNDEATAARQRYHMKLDL